MYIRHADARASSSEPRRRLDMHEEEGEEEEADEDDDEEEEEHDDDEEEEVPKGWIKTISQAHGTVTHGQNEYRKGWWC